MHATAAVLPASQVDPAGQMVCVDESLHRYPAAHGRASELFAGQCIPMAQAVGAVDPAAQAYPARHTVCTSGVGHALPAAHVLRATDPAGQKSPLLHLMLFVASGQ